LPLDAGTEHKTTGNKWSNFQWAFDFENVKVQYHKNHTLTLTGPLLSWIWQWFLLYHYWSDL